MAHEQDFFVRHLTFYQKNEGKSIDYNLYELYNSYIYFKCILFLHLIILSIFTINFP